MKTMQIEAHKLDNDKLLRAAWVRRIREGWYTVRYSGMYLDRSTILSAEYNPGGVIRYR